MKKKQTEIKGRKINLFVYAMCKGSHTRYSNLELDLLFHIMAIDILTAVMITHFKPRNVDHYSKTAQNRDTL